MISFHSNKSCLAATLLALCAANVAAQSAGDFNGDGEMDLAIGMPKNISLSGSGYTSTYEEAGAVVVIYGHDGELDPAWKSDSWDQDDISGVSREAYDRFGAALAVGDFNGDGYDDLAIGAPGEDVSGNSISAAGLVNVLYGSASGLQASNAKAITQNNDGLSNTNPAAGENFGYALAAGDYNGDGVDDLAVGCPDDHDGSGNETGTVHVFFGKQRTASRFGGVRTRGVQRIHQGYSWVPGSRETGEDFGAALATGDFDGDRIDDLAIGIPRDKVGSTRYGGVVLLYGTSSGLDDKGRSHLFNRNTAGVNGTASDGDRFGATLAVGRFDDDSFDDLAIGAPCDTVNGAADAGSVSVLRGSKAGLTSSGDVLMHQDKSAFSGATTEANDNFGAALAAGDFDGDGVDELVIGVPGEDVNSNSDVNAGMIHVVEFPGSSLAGYSQTGIHQDSGAVTGGSESGDRFGAALVTGKFGAGGNDDLIVGVPGEDYNSTTTESEGAINVICGKSSGIGYRDSSRNWRIKRSATGGSNLAERFGACLGAHYWY